MSTARVSPAKVQVNDVLTGVVGPAGEPATVTIVEAQNDSETTITYVIPGVPGYGDGTDAYEQTLTLDNDCRVVVGRS